MNETLIESAISLEGSVSKESPTLEVRWVRPGALGASVIDWFIPFLDLVESRDDIYLVGHRDPSLSVKIRGEAQLDIKVASGDHVVVDVPGRARGHIQSWKKWSFPLPLDPEKGVESPEWVRVEKVRRIGRFSFADGAPAARRAPTDSSLTTCAVELTELVKAGELWWTVGFEVMGQPSAMLDAIEATAALVFSDPMPGGLKLSVVDSKSYAEWLRPRTQI